MGMGTLPPPETTWPANSIGDSAWISKELVAIIEEAVKEYRLLEPLLGELDSFRAGLLTYIANNLDAFRDGSMDFSEAVGMGNLFASVYIKAPLSDRYKSRSYEKMLGVVHSGEDFASFEALEEALIQAL